MQTKLEVEQKASSVILEASVEQETLAFKGWFTVLNCCKRKDDLCVSHGRQRCVCRVYHDRQICEGEA